MMVEYRQNPNTCLFYTVWT